MILEKVKQILADHCDIDPSKITEETTFESLGIDSLDTVEMVMEMEEDLGVELELNEKVKTVGDMVKFIENKVQK